MFRLRLCGAFLAAALQLGGVSQASAADIEVIDGDSLVYDGQKVEIWGIIAPARSETCVTSQGDKWPCGERAFEQLSEASADETFVCSQKEEGFVVCLAGGLDVGRLLVSEGLVRARQDYRDAEARAREDRLGLWE